MSHLSTSKILQPLQFYSTQTNLKNDLKIKEEKVIKVTNTSDVKDFSRAEKLKRAVKEYGSTVIIFHVGISLISLGTCYLLVTMWVIYKSITHLESIIIHYSDFRGLDTTALLNMIGDWTANNKIATNAGTFALAYGIHKIFAPVRIVITLTSVPFIVKYLRNVGFLKK